MRSNCFCVMLVLITFWVQAQKNISFKDSLDHKLDLSDWVLKANGFIPIPMIITEPALGNFGGALFAVFVDQNTPYQDSVDGKLVKTRAKPNIYGAGAAYTANGSWLTGGMAMGVIKKWRANYRIATGFANINLNFYRETPIGEKSFEFNIRSFPVTGHLIKQFGRSSWFAGVNYLFLSTQLGTTNSEFNTPKEVNSIVSRLGVLVDYDSRDNVFTPNKGFRWNTLVGGSSDVIGSDYKYASVNSAAFWYIPIKLGLIGSDYKYASVNSAAFWYIPISPNLISGFRAEYQQVFDNAPFYMKPYVNMRGIPVMRYQGEITTLAETEWRWDFVPRFSAVVFGGAAKAIQDKESFQDASWRMSGGLGGRYLIARKLKLRMGIDVARGPEDWAYYIVFGTNWIR